MRTNRQPLFSKTASRLREYHSPLSIPNEVLWALVGLLLTIACTFVEVSVTNPPWQWAEQGVKPQALGIAYQIGAVLLTGCIGGRNAGAIAQIAYIALGLCWLPVFAQGGGFDYMKEPSFGYLLGFIPGAWVCGWLAFRTRIKLEALLVSAMCGLAVIHLVGIAYLLGLFLVMSNSFSLALASFGETMASYSLEPLPEQMVIVCVVATIAFILRRILFY